VPGHPLRHFDTPAVREVIETHRVRQTAFHFDALPHVIICHMGVAHAEDPGLRPDYLAKRFARLHSRGDIVRKYKDVAEELYDSLVSDIRAGRKRSALVHFRPFADYCLNCLFVAYPASEMELDRSSTPKDAVEAAKRIIEHWEIPVNKEDIKKLRKTYGDLSQAVHGSKKALESFDRMRADLIPLVEKLAQMLLEWVTEADRRLNVHRSKPHIRALMRRIGVPDSSKGTSKQGPR
jgi:hypothetical protein